MIPKSKLIVRSLIFSTLVMTLASPALAQYQKHVGYGDEWQHAIALYGWGLEIGGRTAGGRDIDIAFDDVWDNLEMGFLGTYQARKGRWSLLADVTYLDVEADEQLELIPPVLPGIGERTAHVTVGMEALTLQVSGGYNLYNRENTNADFIFGARYLDLSSDLLLDFTLSLPGQEFDRRFEFSKSDDVWDAIIGFKGSISLGDRWFIPYYADIGGGDSDFTWQASAGIAFKAADWADIALTYRYLAWDLGGELIEELDVSGPILGVIFRF